MRLILRIFSLCLYCSGGLLAAIGATYNLEDGGVILGDPLMATASDAGVKIRQTDGTYTNVAWGLFSQDVLKEFANDEKLTEFVEPFIIITPEEKARMTEVDITEPERLSRPEKGSLLGSLFGSGPGLVIVLLLFGANIYAGYEIAIFRARNVWMVAGLAAIPFLGLISNIVWLSMPTYIERKPEPTEEEMAEMEAMQPDYRVPIASEVAVAKAVAEGRDPSVPSDEVFPRGKFTFNKRFFETRFADFFGTVRRGNQKYNYIIVKTAKAQLVADRITRVTTTELHLNLVRGGSGETGVSFAEIQEVKLTAKA